MKNFIYTLIFLLTFCAGITYTYEVSTPESYRFRQESEDYTLFILDFSNSMSEYLEGKSKADMMVETVKNLLPSINKNSMVGLRIYGHKMGFTPIEACRASTLLVPISKINTASINTALDKSHPKGMTPITYSLKQAIKYDFAGIKGKKHIILLTDGGENCDESPCKFVMELIRTRKDIVIDVIAFNIDDEEDLDQLKCTSLVTSGKFYTANTAAELAKSLEESSRGEKRVEAKILSPNN